MMKKWFRLLFLTTAVLVLLCTGLFGCAKNDDKGWRAQGEFAIDTEVTTLTAGENHKMLVLSDLGLNIADSEQNRLTYNSIAAMVSRVSPNFIVFNGDMVRCGKGGDNLATFKEFLQKADALGVPWTFVFGTDDLIGTTNSAKTLLAEVSGLKNCVFSPTKENIKGSTNQAFILKNSRGHIYRSIILLDSNGVRKYKGKDEPNYFYQSQKDWYYHITKNLNEVISKVTDEDGKPVRLYLPNTFVSHTPLQETMSAYNLGDITFGERPQQGGFSSHNSGMFDVLKLAGSVSDMLFAHNTENNFITYYQNIRYVSCVVSQYKTTNKEGQEIINSGATIMTTSDGFNFGAHYYNADQLYYID